MKIIEFLLSGPLEPDPLHRLGKFSELLPYTFLLGNDPKILETKKQSFRARIAPRKKLFRFSSSRF